MIRVPAGYYLLTSDFRLLHMTVENIPAIGVG